MTPRSPSQPTSGYLSPGARKEKVRQRSFQRARRSRPARYVELRASSSFSFLAASSLPEDLVERAAELDLPTVALIDRNGVYGAPRFYKAAKKAGIRALVGAEITLQETAPPTLGHGGPLGIVPRPQNALPKSSPEPARLTLLVGSSQGYRNLCRLLTAAAKGRAKGDAQTDWKTIAEHAEGLFCLTGGDEGPVARAVEASGEAGARQVLERIAAIFPGRTRVELQRHLRPEEERRNRVLVDLAGRLRLPLAATNGVRYARGRDRPLQDVLTCIRHHKQLDTAGRILAAERERRLKSGEEMTALFSDLPAALGGTLELADELDFTLEDLGYRFPDYPLPPGETLPSYLRQVTWNAARARFRPLTARAQAQIERELAMIEKLDLAGYFLIVWDIVRFCQREGILAQGRGSAANSAVCYALSITAVDPVKMELLFERFLSEERGEWPDIDLDLPSGDQREKVIQYVYQRYGPHGAAMTANVITYRNRSAAREVAKVLGFSASQVDRMAKRLGRWHYDISRGDQRSLPDDLRAIDLDPDNGRVRHFIDLWQQIQNLPRHLGQHSGGMVIAAGRLDEVVPLEPAAMEGRVVVQWDKDDCADLGIIKVDLLGLGMLKALEEAVPLIRSKEGVNLDLAHLPPDDPKVYQMLRKADTVGVFQVESRAQMASLPRNAPRCFYDLVIQVAIIRPGPIQGGMVNPFFERRLGREEVTYAHPSLEPILKRTLGVPLFQEQLLRLAMVAAGFSGGEAEELRRAMGFKRSTERMASIEERLRRGMSERGIVGEAQEQVVRSITSFALYGFPESHAASFALIAYASAYLKAHHPTAFLISLLNAWPMGFYHPSTLIRDAQRHQVEVRSIDVNRSGWRCRWEENGNGRVRALGAARLGLRFVKGLRKRSGEIISEERGSGRYRDTEDLARRCRLQRGELEKLAEVGALASLGSSRREALWQAARVERPSGPLFDRERDETPSPLPEMTALEATQADYRGTGASVHAHPVQFLRSYLKSRGVLSARELEDKRDGDRVLIAGAVIVRQRPGTASGILFTTLEDETGMCQAIVKPDLLEKRRPILVGSPGLVVEGLVQKRDGSLSVRAEKVWALPSPATIPSHDFH